MSDSLILQITIQSEPSLPNKSPEVRGVLIESIMATKITDCIRLHQRPVIIHCAAERRPDKAENNQEAVRQLNVSATENLAQVAKDNAAWLVYISTDYVFDGTKPPYEPEDKPNPLNFYGTSQNDAAGRTPKSLPCTLV